MADAEPDEVDVVSEGERPAVDKKKRRVKKVFVRQAVKEHRENEGASWL